MKKIVSLIILILLFSISCTIEKTDIFVVIDKKYQPYKSAFWSDQYERFWLFLENGQSRQIYKWHNMSAFYALEKGDRVEIYRKGYRADMEGSYLFHVKAWRMK